jgi:small subunit ribosomal protein S19
MARSKWKIPHFNIDLNKKILSKENNIKTRARNAVILEEHVGLTIYIYNGLQYIKTLITKDMVNHKFGEYAHSRKKKITNKK